MARPSRIPASVRDLMAAGARHAWTLEEIQSDLAQCDVSADFSSVFRAVERLETEGAIRRVHIDDGPARFEPTGAHHDHLHCVRCNRLIPVACLTQHIDIAALEAETGFTITGHSVVLNGVCARCRTECFNAPGMAK